MAAAPAFIVSTRRDVGLYRHTLGGALRGAGNTAFGFKFDGIPLVYRLNLPSDAAAEIERNTLLGNELQLAVAPLVQEHLRRVIAPTLSLTENLDGLPAKLETLLRGGLPNILARIEPIIAQRTEAGTRWRKVRNGNMKEFASVTVTLALSAAAAGLGGLTGSVAIAAAVLGIVRGLADGAKLYIDCWQTVEEQHERLIQDITRLTQAYRNGVVSGRAMQIGGAVFGATGAGKLVQVGSALTRAVGLHDRGQRNHLPTMKIIEEGMTLYRGKLGHLYCYTGMLATRLTELLAKIEAFGPTRPGSALDRLEASVAQLLDSGVTGRRNGFRGRFTVSEGFRRYETGLRGLDAAEAFLTELSTLEAHPRAMAIATQTTTLAVNAGLALMNYPQALHLPVHASADQVGEALGVLQDGAAQSGSAVTAAAFGWFNDSFGTAKDVTALIAELGFKTGVVPPEVASIAQAVRTQFSTPPAAPPTPSPPRLPDTSFGPSFVSMFSV